MNIPLLRQLAQLSNFGPPKWPRLLPLLAGLLALASQAQAQLSGTYTIDPAGSGATNYTTFAAAFNALNTQGVAGAVTFNVKDGATFTESNLILNTITGASATNTITFQRDNSGATAPLISAAVGLSTNVATAASTAGTNRDAIIVLNGSDYVTLRGLTLVDPTTNATTTTQMEFGVLMTRPSNTNGPQNNTITGCSITLQKGNTTSASNTAIGIASVPFTMATINGTALSATGASAAGRADNNKFYSNSIQNVNTGIYVLGLNDATSPYTYYDQGNEIGGAGAAGATTGNTITNYGGTVASTTSYGIHVNFQAQAGGTTSTGTTFPIGNNTINNLTGGGANAVSTLYGIFYNTTTNNINVAYNYNTVNITQGSSNATHAIYSNPGGGTTNGATTTMTNNTITVNVTVASTALSAESNGLYSAGSTGTVNIANNTVTMAPSTTGTVVYSGTARGIYNNTSLATLNMSGNTVNYTPSIASSGAVSGSFYGVYNTGSTTGTMTVSGNTATVTRSGSGSGAVSATAYLVYNSGAATGALTYTNNTFGPASGTATVAQTGTMYVFYNSSSSQNVTATGNTLRNIAKTAGALYGYYNIGGASGGTQTITGNTLVNVDISNGGAATGALYGIYTSASSQQQVIGSNTINGLTSGTGTIYGIYNTGASSTSTFNTNTITNFYTYSGTGTQYGMYLSSGAATVQGNSVSSLYTDGTGTQYGMYLVSGLGGTNIFNNTVDAVSCSGTGSSARYGIYHNPSSNSLYSNTVTNITATNPANTGAVYGMYEEGGSAAGMNCYSNTISGVQTAGTGAAYGMALTGTSGITNAYSNTIFNVAGTTGTVYGIYTSHTGSAANVYKNRVYGIGLTGASGTVYGLFHTVSGSGNTVNAYNNLIWVNGRLTAGGTATGTLTAAGDNVVNGIGVAGTAAGTVSLSFNTVYLDGNSTGSNFGSSAIYISSASPVVNLRNNIFDNTMAPGSTGATVAYRRSAPPTSTNTPGATNSSNIYYAATPGAQNLLYAEGTSTLANQQQTIAGFRSYFGGISGGEGTSVTDAPVFVNSTNGSNGSTLLHLDPSTPTAAESGAVVIAGIADDYDGQPRNTSTPDIGADEGTFIPKDLAPPAIVYTALINTNITTGRTLTATITDASGVATGGNAPRLYYRKGTTGSFVSSTATTVSGSSYTFTFDYSLVGGVVAGDVVQYYVAAQDNTTPTANGGSNPSGSTDINPPGTTFSGTPNSYTILPTLTGNYYVGTTAGPYGTPAYATLTAAAAVYNNAGISGSVSFILVDASYAGETYPITFNNNSTASAANNLTIKPYTGVTPSFSGSHASALIKFNGASYITLDGSNAGTTSRNWTLTNTATTAASTPVWISSNGVGAGSTFITVKNLNISTGSTSVATSGISVSGTTVNSTGADNDNITLQNNAIANAYYGIYVAGTATASAGGLDNLVVTANTIGSSTNSIGNTGLLLNNAVTPQVTNNTIQYVSAGTPRGMNLTNLAGATVAGNTIANMTSTSTTGIGLLVGSNVTNAVINRNSVHDFVNTSTAGYGSWGIQIATATANSNVVVSNNLVYNFSGDGWSSLSASSHAGIYLTTTMSGVRVVYNTVNMAGTTSRASTAVITAALGVESGPTGLTVLDNILVNSFTSTTVSTAKAYAFFSNAANTAYTTINYNDYYVTGAGSQGVLGYIGSTARADLAALRTGTGQDLQSQNIDPQFISATNLKPLSATLDNLGNPVAGVTTDYVNAARSTSTPDIGAYEYSPPQDDAGVVSIDTPVAPFAAGNQTITVKVNNTGITDLNNVTLTYTYTPVSGAPVTVTEYFDSFPSIIAGSGSTVQLTFVTPLSVTGAGGTLVVTSSLPNGETDANNTNDSQTRTLRPGLSGLYTVGAGGTRDFVTLDAAVAALNSAGAIGAVTFSLVDATYPATSGVVINQFPGGSATNTLTIKPATGVSPTLTTTTAASAVIKLNGADYVTIDGSNTAGGITRNLTLTSLNTGTSAVVWVSSLGTGAGASNNTIKNTNLVGGSVSSTTAFGIYAAGTSITTSGTGAANNSLTVQNNAISKAYEAVYVRGVASTGPVTGLLVTGNSIGADLASTANTVTLRGVDMVDATTPTISGNTIFGMQTTSTLNIAAIDLGQNTGGAVVSKNVIYSLRSTNAGGYGAYGVNISSATGTDGIEISNNMIADLGAYGYLTSTSDNAFGIRITGGSGQKVYFNTVNMGTYSYTSTEGISAALLITAGTVDSRNNIFTNSIPTSGSSPTTKSYALYAGSASYLATSDYNDYYVSGARGVLAYVTNGDKLTLADLQAATSQDVNSMNVAPVYTATPANAGDLHLQPNNNGGLNNQGTPISGLTTDIDSDTRSASSPDPGADEFTPTIVDIAVVSASGPAAPFAAGTYPTTVTISNNGGPTVSTVDVSYTFNGVTTNLGTITLGTPLTTGSTAVIPLGNQTYVSGANNISVSATNPNGTAEVAPADLTNNSLATVIYTALCGTYTVGATGNFPTLDAAVMALNNGGASCPVLFSLIDATYPASSGISVDQFPGNGSGVTLTIKPATGVQPVLETTSSASYLLRLNGTDYVTIDGSNTVGGTTQDLTLSSTNTAGAGTLLISSLGTGAGATNNTLKNTILNGASASAGIAISIGGAVGATGADNDNTTIQNNLVQRAYIGLYSGGTATASTGGADNLTITGNTFGPAANGTSNLNNAGLFLSNQVNPVITNNTIQNVRSTTTNYGILLSTGVTGANIAKNTIDNIVTSGSGYYAYGITLSSNTLNAVVDANKITNINTTGAYYGPSGIYVNTGLANSNIVIKNNFIGGVQGAGYTSTLYATAGIKLNSTMSGISIYHNSVSLTGTNNYYSSSTFSAALLVISGATGLNVVDNIFANSQTNIYSGYTGKAYAIYSSAPATAYTTVNYNDYYVSGTDAVLGYYSADKPTLADIQTASTQDANSLNVDPTFTSATDLHIDQLNTVVNNAGTPIAGITVDIDNQTRSTTTPDLGADEYTPATGDVGIVALLQPAATNCYGGSRPVKVAIRNYTSTATYFPVPVTVAVTPPAGGGAVQTISGSTSRVIPANDTIQFVVGNYAVTTSGNYTFDASTAFGNDTNNANNLFSQTVSVTIPNTISVVASPTAATTTGICAGELVTLTASSATAYTYTWTATTGGALNSTTGATVTANPTQTTTYTATGIDGACTIYQTITIVVNPLPLVTLTSSPTPVCAGNSAQLKAINASDINSLKITEVTINRSASTGQTASYPAYVPSTAIELIEISNVSNSPVDIGGMVFESYYNSTTGAVTTLNRSVTLPAGTTVPAQDVLLIAHSTLSAPVDDPTNRLFYATGSVTDFQSGSSSGFLLKNGSTIVDAVLLNSASFPASAGVSSSDFSGAIPSSSSQAGVIRSAATDTNTAADFTVTSASNVQTIGTYNGGYTIATPFSYSYSATPSGGTFSSTSVKNPTFTAPTGTYTISVLTTNNTTGCSVTRTTTVTITDQTVWTGATSTDWFTSTNWTNCVPTEQTDAIVPNGPTNMPAIAGATAAATRSLSIGTSGTGNAAVVSLTGGSTVLNIKGDLMTTGIAAFNAGNATTVNFSGTTAQNIGAAKFGIITLSGSGSTAKVLSGDVNVGGSLDLTNGMLDTNGNTLTMLNQTSTIVGADASHYVMTNGTTGKLTINGIGSTGRSGAVVFPVGTSNYTPATLVNIGSNDAFTVTVGNGISRQGTAVTSHVVNKTWDVSEATTGGSDVTLTLQWNGVDEIGGFNRNSAAIAHYESGAWNAQCATCYYAASGSDPYSISRSNISTFSPFGVQDNTKPLPVELTRFEAVREGGNALLTWNTASEKNNAGFDVQVSTDGRTFRSLHFVEPASPSSTAPRTYVYTDREAGKAGLRYYRLRQVDLDGSASFSPVRTVDFGKTSETSLNAVPNPFSSQLTLFVQAQTASTSTPLTVTDASGRTVLTQKLALPAGLSQVTINELDNLPAGMYLLHLTVDGQAQHLKVVKK